MGEISSDLENMMMSDVADQKEEKEEQVKKKLGELSKMINDMELLENQISDVKKTLNTLNEQHSLLSNVRIPDLFDEIGLSQVKLPDGSSVEIKRKYAATITAANAHACLKWLNEHGHGSLIKHDVAVSLKKEEKEEYKELIKGLCELGVTFKDKKYVHHSTLAAFVKGMMESGDPDFPQDLFKVYPLRSTKVSK